MDMQFYRKMFFSTALLLASATGLLAQEAAIWALGKADQSSQEFALSPQGFNDFLAHDDGYEDNLFEGGQSLHNQDLPYVVPGPANGWGGTGGASGIRTYFLNRFYPLDAIHLQEQYVLQLDF